MLHPPWSFLATQFKTLGNVGGQTFITPKPAKTKKTKQMKDWHFRVRVIDEGMIFF
jgi:hypothetical protein